MARLIELSPCAGLLPLTIGRVTLTEIVPGAVHLIAPFAGRQDAVADRLSQALGVGFPAVNRVESGADCQILWAGRGRALLVGAAVPDGIADIAAVTDQSDGAAVVRIAGPTAEAVLARLVPVDLRLSAFGTGATLRSMVNHMSAQIVRVAPDTLDVIVFRSMAATLVHEMSEAARGVAARGGNF